MPKDPQCCFESSIGSSAARRQGGRACEHSQADADLRRADRRRYGVYSRMNPKRDVRRRRRRRQLGSAELPQVAQGSLRACGLRVGGGRANAGHSSADRNPRRRHGSLPLSKFRRTRPTPWPAVNSNQTCRPQSAAPAAGTTGAWRVGHGASAPATTQPPRRRRRTPHAPPSARCRTAAGSAAPERMTGRRSDRYRGMPARRAAAVRSSARAVSPPRRSSRRVANWKPGSLASCHWQLSRWYDDPQTESTRTSAAQSTARSAGRYGHLFDAEPARAAYEVQPGERWKTSASATTCPGNCWPRSTASTIRIVCGPASD